VKEDVKKKDEETTKDQLESPKNEEKWRIIIYQECWIYTQWRTYWLCFPEMFELGATVVTCVLDNFDVMLFTWIATTMSM
jgi:hypothetical protein